MANVMLYDFNREKNWILGSVCADGVRGSLLRFGYRSGWKHLHRRESTVQSALLGRNHGRKPHRCRSVRDSRSSRRQIEASAMMVPRSNSSLKFAPFGRRTPQKARRRLFRMLGVTMTRTFGSVVLIVTLTFGLKSYGGEGAPSQTGQSNRAIGASPPSILPQCFDPMPTTVGVGPSARARECTRQYCERPDYRAKVTAYAMNQRQSPSEQAEALTCITRAEQDRARK